MRVTLQVSITDEELELAPYQFPYTRSKMFERNPGTSMHPSRSGSGSN